MNSTLNDELKDALQEMFNIGIGRAAGTLNELLNSHVSLSVPHVALLSAQDLIEKSDIDAPSLSAVALNFSGDFSGTGILGFSPESAASLVSALTGEEVGSLELDTMRASTLTEVGNIIMNAVLGTLSNIVEGNLKYTIPLYFEEENLSGFLLKNRHSYADTILIVKATIVVSELKVVADIIVMFALGSLEKIIAAIKRKY